MTCYGCAALVEMLERLVRPYSKALQHDKRITIEPLPCPVCSAVWSMSMNGGNYRDPPPVAKLGTESGS